MNSTQATMLDTIAMLRLDVTGQQPMLRNERNDALRFLAGIEALLRADAEQASRIAVFAMAEI